MSYVVVVRSSDGRQKVYESEHLSTIVSYLKFFNKREFMWQPHHDEDLMRLHNLSASEAASELTAKYKRNFTRNAVIGRRNRLRIKRERQKNERGHQEDH